MHLRDHTPGWEDLVSAPDAGEHIVQAYGDETFLADAATRYIGTGLRAGEGAIVIATPSHRRLFEAKLPGAQQAQASGQLRVLDAEACLARFAPGGELDWDAFRREIGGAIAEVRLQFAGVRLYGEIVDLLWQRGEREQAMRLEAFWNELARLQTFSLFCAYRMDPLDPDAYDGLEAVCKAHTQLIPTRDYARFNRAVGEASEKVLEQPLQQMLFSLAVHHRPSTGMPLGQVVLLWLNANMPRTAERVLAEVRARC